MNIELLPDGTTKEVYTSETEYNNRGQTLYAQMGRHQIVYEGWLNEELVRILRS